MSPRVVGLALPTVDPNARSHALRAALVVMAVALRELATAGEPALVDGVPLETGEVVPDLPLACVADGVLAQLVSAATMPHMSNPRPLRRWPGQRIVTKVGIVFGRAHRFHGCRQTSSHQSFGSARPGSYGIEIVTISAAACLPRFDTQGLYGASPSALQSGSTPSYSPVTVL